ncbi:tvp38/tmem64 family membrane protein slr0305 [Phtheirospermum japonicum]|uniref:Tvp38/tmem64 family membrane protein slr0305 n=1 Tax=Phtheirospermum japonicum TaxID=374723 RepID=A0A830CFZ0_9LAMI|nr:tvp38/tmem64 family membrane protein slr0305 [Phtheirospermum japonicum]
MACKITWVSFFKFLLLLLLVAGIVIACFTLPVEKMLKDFLVWVDKDLGHWGPLVLAVAYIPLTILAVPASVLTLGGGYLFGLPIGFLADSIGATLGAGAAFLLGRTLGRSFVISKLKDYPQFNAVAIAIEKSGFKIVLLLRLVPLLPFNMLNYLLSVTPVALGPYLMASWLGMMPITLALVYVGTTLKDISDVTHGWSGLSKTRWAFIALSFVVSVAKAALDKALAETEGVDGDSESPIAADDSESLRHPLLAKINNHQEKLEI